ncbi:Stp1/IreP family PP2C-type Ser/Thr phosphatase [Bombilactobacillus folatiphilus]|uniref:Stp1/IreP family PP2C-type Ser/Thr phosphatase n=1 Tax=Bombilactobacillus folatiphilus TaxID=2923362 RepID=A0ABY4P7K2_9LACO|nr:Stp1/IreP family PP2C-type Ser/Thr phosphatase [Bombilactobacillus folatiphilus]UQS81617.1 Stp1/IreP family PP2C-type Ser/Thr phosphatase [Bombilactobacillus folatiphilus]
MQIAFSTDIGKHRKTNQDDVQVYQNQCGVTLALVADGMGGHRGGDVASDMVIRHFGLAFEQNQVRDIRALSHWTNDFLIQENQRVIDAANRKTELNGMGTTIVGAFVFPDQVAVFNVGDSRCYLFNAGKLRQVSFDHSLVNELLVAGEITPEEARTFPNKNIITQSLGVSADVKPTFGFFDLIEDSQILLCSDGLTNMLSNHELQEVLKLKLSPQQKCDLFIQKANQAGGLDNITALVIDLALDSEDETND